MKELSGTEISANVSQNVALWATFHSEHPVHWYHHTRAILGQLHIRTIWGKLHLQPVTVSRFKHKSHKRGKRPFLWCYAITFGACWHQARNWQFVANEQSCHSFLCNSLARIDHFCLVWIFPASAENFCTGRVLGCCTAIRVFLQTIFATCTNKTLLPQCWLQVVFYWLRNCAGLYTEMKCSVKKNWRSNSGAVLKHQIDGLFFSSHIDELWT